MMNSGSTRQRAPYLKILTDDQINEIRRAAFDVMFTAGFTVFHEGVRDMLKKAGAVVRGEWVNVPEFIVNECLARTFPPWLQT